MVNQVAIVAVLASFEVAVPAGGRAGVGRPRPVGSSADRLHGAGFRAAGAVAVEEAVRARATGWQLRRIGAAVAGLSRLKDAVTTYRLRANAGRSGTAPAWLDLAGRRAAVTTIRIPVVAWLAELDVAVAAYRGTGFSWHVTLPPGFNRLAVSRAAVTADSVSVVTDLVGGQHVVSTYPLIHATLARGRTLEIGFDLAKGIAASINGIITNLLGRGDAVVAQLAVVKNAIPAVFAMRYACHIAPGSTGGTAGAEKAGPAAAAAATLAAAIPASALALPASPRR